MLTFDTLDQFDTINCDGNEKAELLKVAYQVVSYLCAEPAAVGAEGTWSGGTWIIGNVRDGRFASFNAYRTGEKMFCLCRHYAIGNAAF